MNQSNKLSLFFGLDAKPLKDVILHHPDWTIHCGNTTIEVLLNQTRIVRKAYKDGLDMNIEAIPELVSVEIMPYLPSSVLITCRHF